MTPRDEPLSAPMPEDTAVASSPADQQKKDGAATTTLFFNTYLLLWCGHLIYPVIETKVIAEGHGSYDLRPFHAWDLVALYPLVATILYACCSNHTIPFVMELALAAHVLDLVIKVDRMPALWDHEHWGMLTQVAFVTAYACCYRGGSSSTTTTKTAAQMEAWFAWAVQLQYGILYAAAAFWKLNTSFFHHEISCGSLLLLELVGSYIYIDFSPEALVFLAKAAPTLTFIGEAAISIFMLYGCVGNKRPVSRDIGVLLAVFFHTTVILLPVNAAGGFTLSCMSRFICFFDSTEITRLYAKLGSLSWTTLTLRTLAAGASLPLLRYCMLDILPDTGLAACGILILFYSTLIGVQPYYYSKATVVDSSTTATDKPGHKLALGLLQTLTFVYAFITPILGVQQMGASTMYGNLRSYGPSNHFMVPTAILGDDILYGGGLVRIISSTSATLNLQFGHVLVAEVVPERVRELTAIGRGGSAVPPGYPFQVFPYVMTSPHSAGQLREPYLRSQAVFEEQDFFLSYILPISRISEALHEAAAAGEDFVVVLADAGTSSEVIIDETSHRLEIGTNLSCAILQDGKRVGGCENDPIASLLLQPKEGLVQRLVRKLLIPYPRLVEVTEGEMCVT